MEKLPVNPNCALSGTKYCAMLNMHTCANCTVRDSENKTEIISDLDLFETLLPEGGIARLFESRDCQFCKTPVKGKRRGYAILDMAHPEPRRLQKWLFGSRMSRIGTMIPVQMGVCPKCRKRFMLMEYLPMLIPVVIGVAALFAQFAGRSIHVCAVRRVDRQRSRRGHRGQARDRWARAQLV